jgi:hypothetical protein
MSALRHRVFNELDSILIEDVAEERVREASRPNIRGRKRIYALAKKEKNGV